MHDLPAAPPLNTDERCPTGVGVPTAAAWRGVAVLVRDTHADITRHMRRTV
jgi:hypothetical protein